MPATQVAAPTRGAFHEALWLPMHRMQIIRCSDAWGSAINDRHLQRSLAMPILKVTISRRPDRELAKKIAEGLVERTSRILGKSKDVTAVAIDFVQPEHWIVGGHSLEDQGLASFWLDIKVTDSTNTKDEKASYLREVFAFMGTVLGPLHDESYALVHDVRADAYGYGGKTQEFRYVKSQLEASQAAR